MLRYVFLLYKQEGKVEMEPELRKDPLNLKDRNFSTLDFYSTYQVGFHILHLPGGLAYAPPTK